MTRYKWKWTPERVDRLCELWPDHSASEICRILKAESRSGVIGKATQLGLHKNPKTKPPPLAIGVSLLVGRLPRPKGIPEPRDPRAAALIAQYPIGSSRMRQKAPGVCLWPGCVKTARRPYAHCERHIAEGRDVTPAS